MKKANEIFEYYEDDNREYSDKYVRKVKMSLIPSIITLLASVVVSVIWIAIAGF